jgi:hypothetical protein
VNFYMFVVEYQNRGGAHFHLLLSLADSPQTPEDVNELVRADVPDAVTEADLFVLVERYMVHGRCGPKCMPLNAKGQCRKGMPTAFVPATLMDNGHGRVEYM